MVKNFLYLKINASFFIMVHKIPYPYENQIHPQIDYNYWCISHLRFERGLWHPKLMNYQAVVRSGTGQPLANTLVNLQFKIHDGSSSGTVIFQGTDTVTTNQFGLVTMAIGSSGNLSTVN